MKWLILPLCLLLGGCASPVPPQRGGIATIGKGIMAPFKWTATKVSEAVKPAITANPKPLAGAGGGEVATITQPDAPGQQSAQNYDYSREVETTFASPTVITEETTTPEGNKLVKTTHVPAGSKTVVKETQKVGQTLGAAQKDTARADAAWLASFQWVQGIGVLVLLIGIVGFAHPAARLLIGGKDTAMMVGGAGLVMIFGPAFLQKYGNYFAIAIVVAGLYWFWSRSKHKEGQLDALQAKPPV